MLAAVQRFTLMTLDNLDKALDRQWSDESSIKFYIEPIGYDVDFIALNPNNCKLNIETYRKWQYDDLAGGTCQPWYFKDNPAKFLTHIASYPAYTPRDIKFIYESLTEMLNSTELEMTDYMRNKLEQLDTELHECF